MAAPNSQIEDHGHASRSTASSSFSLSPALSTSSLQFQSFDDSTLTTPSSMPSNQSWTSGGAYYGDDSDKWPRQASSAGPGRTATSTSTSTNPASINGLLQSLTSAPTTGPKDKGQGTRSVAQGGPRIELGLPEQPSTPPGPWGSVSDTVEGSAHALGNATNTIQTWNTKVAASCGPSNLQPATHSGLSIQHDANACNQWLTLPRQQGSQTQTQRQRQTQRHAQRQSGPVRPVPLRTASTRGVAVLHPTPSVCSRSSSNSSRIAHLEASAEELSLSLSIEDAIRKLHDQQKQIDSEKSSALAAFVERESCTNSNSLVSPTRQASATSSTHGTYQAVRSGGYRPSAYVKSPNGSVVASPTRLRTGPYAQPEANLDATILSRSNTGKSSVRSGRSLQRPSLEDIAETPSAVSTAMAEASERPSEDLREVQELQNNDSTATAEPCTPSNHWGDAAVCAQMETAEPQNGEARSSSAGPTSTQDHSEGTFADFDGAHCSPDADSSQPHRTEPQHMISRPHIMATTPNMYTNPELGEQIVYYPARIPAMLKLPQKLSKKPKAAVRDTRRSQILSVMSAANVQPDNWLPEVHPGSPLVSDRPFLAPEMDQEARAGAEQQAPSGLQPTDSRFDTSPRASVAMSAADPADKHKPRTGPSQGIGSHLRASAYFDLPSERRPNVALKDGSATATLDSILDASARAPVWAFTDHVHAGSLGSEVYGTESKPNKSQQSRPVENVVNATQVKKRSSFFRLRSSSKLSLSLWPSAVEDNKLAAPTQVADEGRMPLSDIESATKGEGADGEEGVEEDDEVIHGQPTTLLAELQYRKQQQKLRTRRVPDPNRLQSTLLDLDTVAEVERKHRTAKKVNLTWEEASHDVTDLDSEDEDVPLGMLMATQKSEMVRPPGLMERRQMEEAEPLSLRRSRLQGYSSGLRERPSLLTLGGGARTRTRLGVSSPSYRNPTPEQLEVEETMGERKRRLQAREDGGNHLPPARPASTSFSVDLLGHLDKGGEDAATSKGKENVELPEEDETLGQRRRRLQAEREAREREIGSGATGKSVANTPTLTKKLSMADVLGATASRSVLSDPRAEPTRGKQEEAARSWKDQEQKLAALRAQMPTNLSSSNVQRSGGFMSGQFNDGSGGLGGRQHVRVASQLAGPYDGPVGAGNNIFNGGYGLSNGHLRRPTQQLAPQYDRVDQWRQSIMPSGELR